VSFTQRLGAVVVATFAIAFRRAPWLIRLMNPVMRWLLLTPLPAGPNALLIVCGRRSGLPRTAPVAFLDLGSRSFLQAASAEVSWVRNLRASGEAVIKRGRQSEKFQASELAPESAGPVVHELLAPFPRSRLIPCRRRSAGPTACGCPALLPGAGRRQPDGVHRRGEKPPRL